jgi:PAS domain S-box-containing protein
MKNQDKNISLGLEMIYRDLFETMDQNIFLWEALCDKDGNPYDLRLIDANQALFRLLNRPKEEFIGKTFRELGLDADPQMLKFSFNVLKTGRPDKKEFIGPWTKRFLTVSASSPRKGYLAWIANDITEIKKATQELKDSEERAKMRSEELEKVLDSVPAAVWIAHDPKALKITGNKYSYFWLNLPVGANASKSAPEGERPETFIIRKDGKELAPEEMPVQVSARGEELRNFEFTLVYRDGSERHVLGNAVPIFDEKGLPKGSVASFMDITDRKKAIEALKESEQKWVTTLSSIADGVIASDLSCTISFMNAEAEILTGWKAKEALNKPLKEIFQLIGETDRRPIDLFKKDQSNDQVLLIARDGREFPVEFKRAAIKSESKKITGNVIVFRDITVRRKAEEFMRNYSLNLEETVKIRTAELETAKEKAESADRIKSAFLATMSHELRTPLNSIIGFSGILVREIPGPLNNEQKKQLGMIQSSGRSLLSLINDILDLSKIEAGQLSIHYDVFSLKEVMEEIIKMISPVAEEKGIALKLECDEIDIECDQQRVHQIMLNLINNAVKFTDSGSVTIKCSRDRNAVKFEIVDTGSGISKENLPKLFTPFFQIENSLNKRYKGSGLGLSICQKLVELLHGTISATSELDKGSTFTVILPVKNLGY